VFVTGTGTAVGKTVAAAALIHRYRGSRRIRYWKPIQTGIEQDDDTSEVRRLGVCSEDGVLVRGIRLPRPLSPHLSARLCGRTIEMEPLVADIAVEPRSDCWVVEGAGGVLVPINESALMVDLMMRLALPVVIVAGTKLGTINHTLLTVEALRGRSLAIAGVVLIGDRNPDNRQAIEHFGQVAVLGELPHLDPLTPEALGRWAAAELDPEARLAGWFR
jgi:dethiobiotin synthetase